MTTGMLLSAQELDISTITALEQRFEKIIGDTVSLTVKVDESLISGIQIVIDGRIYDVSFKAQLNKIQQLLSSGGELIDTPDYLTYIGNDLHERIKKYERRPDVRGTGTVLSAGDGIARISGLRGCRLGELIEFENNAFGIAHNLEEDEIGVVILTGEENISMGSVGYGTGQVLSVPVGDAMLGRVVNSLGQPIDGNGRINATEMRKVESPSPSILDRQPVGKPMETGLICIDAMVPIGRGQRELIIGDRQTGKTSVAIDAILNQRGNNVLCVYVAIGQKASTVAHLIETLRKNNAMEYCCVVCSTASDSATMQYIAPYCGCAIAEHFMYSGRDALIIYDDLSKHAVAYRAMSLLLRRPPGREAYPGDVFYLHSRLLEGAAKLSDRLGGGSMTALPIIETQSGDISAYIPTNVISITDGQIFLDAELFRAGVRPAVNVGLSVSRVGGAAQTKAMRKVAGQLRLELAQYREMLVFSQFSSDLDKTTQDMLNYGERLTELLKQRNNAPLKTAYQVALLYAITHGILPINLPLDQVRKFRITFPAYMREHHSEIEEMLVASGILDEKVEEAITKAVNEWLALEAKP